MEERIEYLLQRYLDRRETREELDELMDLIASDKHQDLIEAKLGRDLHERITEASFGKTKSLRVRLKNIKERTFQTPLFQIAAVVSIIITVFFLKLLVTDVNPVAEPHRVVLTTVTTKSGAKKVMLSDGSIVWLKGESRLTYPQMFEGRYREVTLEGEALFEVAKDASRPFIIDCGSLTTKVLGTSFNIKSDPGNAEILVLTGKVSVTPKGEKESVDVHPNEKIVYSEKSRLLTKSQSPKKEIIAFVEKTEYNMSFNDVPMREVARKIGEKFNVTVKFAEPRMENCFITADFTDQSLEATLSMISKSLNFTYDLRDNLVMISGVGCEADFK